MSKIEQKFGTLIFLTNAILLENGIMKFNARNHDKVRMLNEELKASNVFTGKRKRTVSAPPEQRKKRKKGTTSAVSFEYIRIHSFFYRIQSFSAQVILGLSGRVISPPPPKKRAFFWGGMFF